MPPEAPRQCGLYDSQFEHDACGVGFVARLDGDSRHAVVTDALTALKNLAHRGAAGADADSGDGAGILMRIPDALLREDAGIDLPSPEEYALGMAFLPQAEAAAAATRREVEEAVAIAGWRFLGWREVPVRPEHLGQIARDSMPSIWQFFALPPHGETDGETRERMAYVLRKRIEHALGREPQGENAFYIASLSFRTVVYKGMMNADQVERFYPDLADERTASPFAIVHQRYSTNTFPAWHLAHPFRTLAHNGEINTIRGNRNHMKAREPGITPGPYGDELANVFPVLEERASDSASLDNALEFLKNGGRTVHHAMAMLMPQAWGQKYPMGPDMRGFFEFHAGLMEPWDGPAAVVYTDGIRVGACLDRNGLRPARYTVTTDNVVIFASEAGVLRVPDAQAATKGALRPGQMLLADPEEGRLVTDYELKMRLARRQPYRRWVEENRIDIHGFFSDLGEVTADREHLPFRQRLFGYTRDDAEIILEHMASKGMEPTGSMGADVPLAVFSDQPQSLFSYFRQQFAQITNPPIDPIREELVMSLMTFMGNSPDILAERPSQARLVKMKHPVLSNDDLARIRDLGIDDFQSVTLPSLFDRPTAGCAPGAMLRMALDKLEDAAESAVRSGVRLVILSDRNADALHPPIPSLLAAAAVNRRLSEKGLRVGTGLICETGEMREVTHLALLLGLGVSAVNPWLAFESVAAMAANRDLSAPIPSAAAAENYVHALTKGLMKIMSKMGISTLRSYRGAQVFEAVGLGREVMDRYFPGIASKVGGIGLAEIEREAVERLRLAEAGGPVDEPEDALPTPLPVGGIYRYRKNGERHLWTPETITLLQKAVREDDVESYRKYAERINNQATALSTLRGMLEFVPAAAPVPLDEVEPVEDIMKRFATGAMSFGSLSAEAHETMAIAMNRIGSKSNSGEGGEDPARYRLLPNGDNRSSAIKQVASGRFGVSIEYLNNAREIQIKIAQGAKPGEGGQLPGHKVNAEIARVRNSTPGVTLISPPPHHDIYSIEDIAQLIHDLKQANDQARISVKLVSEAGVGTIAAGVAKAQAGMILIAGHDGGTGASPLSSIKGAGSPWEIGLAETQQTLILNNLRGRVRIQADGQMKTGRDVAVAALLGADEFGFATAPLVSMGCVMMRKCHTNGCPVGVATQDPELRRRFAGKPEHVINLFRFIAGELREIMAMLGVRRLDDMIGRSDLLRVNGDIDSPKADGIDFEAILATMPADRERRAAGPDCGSPAAVDGIDDTVMDRVMPVIEKGTGTVTVTEAVQNTDRTIGAKLSSRIARIYGAKGLADGSITLNLKGSAGQSFGAFLAPGITLSLEGEANDYVGKGLSGGRIVVRTAADAGYRAADSVVVGNVSLYGATAGEMFVNGRAGERFAVRNSGAVAVAEGVGDHGCEYMTGGRVVVAGPTGVNFAAGMSGGIAYVYDEDGMFDTRCNLEMVDLDLLSRRDQEELKRMLEAHLKFTGSAKVGAMLENWEGAKGRFVKVFPMEYRRALGEMLRADAQTPRREKELV
ncbi:MAG: glutamate synthase large subunit [Planctomycetaceae bacterium]|nr:glutamate synthase large subunit [Planctomycetaceae bacterium]